MKLKGETIALLAALECVALAHAQDKPKRLSDWLLEQPASPTDFPLGVSWRVPGEAPAQQALRLELLKSLFASDGAVTADPKAKIRMHEWLSKLPVTGRVPVPVADARWLQANPNRDPVLLPGHTVFLPKRPLTVTVVTGTATLCRVGHAPGHEAAAYVRACDPAAAARTDWVWIAQPDGRIQRFGIAQWNREAQNELAPGAWIWAPPRDSGWPERFSEKLIAFLATQGPAPDPVSEPQAAPSQEKSAVASDQPAGGAAGGASHGVVLPTRRRELAKSDAGESTAALSPPNEAMTRSRGPIVTASDWGNAGLLQTPSARMRETGHFSFNLSRTQPYTLGNVFFQPFGWLETGFRYIDISNRLYGTLEFGGGQSAKDKSIDLKFQLWPESAYLPQIALGLRDAAGTGLFAGEYVVASKRTGDLDWSLGLGWGYLAGAQRQIDIGQGGKFSFGNYFKGPRKPFGGVQYHTPIDKVVLKLEYDGNNFQNEPLANNQKRRSPVNFGMVYRAARSVDLTLGVERGNTVTFGIALHTNLDGLSTPKLHDPPAVAVAPARPQQARDWSSTSRDIKTQVDWNVRAIEQRGRELRVEVADAGGVHWRERVDRVVAVLHRDAPATVDRFVITYKNSGIPMAEHVVDRDTWVTPKTRPLPPREQKESVIARAPESAEADATVYAAKPPAFEHGIKLGFAQTIGGPDGFVLYQVYADERAKLRLSDNTWVQGSLRLRLVDNYDKFRYTGPSEMPRVRTFLREYLTSSRVTIPNLQITHTGKLTENSYYSVYGGYLEEMFAGVGGEWLYRPFASRFAFGIDINEVKQRNFRQNFDFRNAGIQTGYRTTTGHATLYWDTGWNDVLATVSAGRYLAKDSGATLQLSRVFKNGVALGAFATRTNVSAARFGEGSFDKGIFLQIPFDVMLTKSSDAIGTFVWKPLTRDGGAKLGRAVALYDMTNLRNDRTLKLSPAPPENDTVIPSDRREPWAPKAGGLVPHTAIEPKPAAAQWTGGSTTEFQLHEALYRQQFRNIKIEYDGSHRLSITLANDHLHPISRAVGRVARTALQLAPLETREIHVTFAARTDLLAKYEFVDLGVLARYFSGTVSAQELAKYVVVTYLNPSAHEKDPLAHLDDIEPEARPKVFTALVPDTFSVGRIKDDVVAATQVAANTNWLYAGAVGTGMVLSSTALDRRADRYAKNHAASRWIKDGTRVGNALPWLGLAGSALLAFDGSDPRRSRTGYAATEAGITAILASTGLKYAVGRARPKDELGHRTFNRFTTDNRYGAFPSRHTSVAWAVVTPFALEYNAPWLYGAALATNLARVGSREHWVSDTVAGSLIGYGLGRIFWEGSRSRDRSIPRVWLSATGIHLAWETE